MFRFFYIILLNLFRAPYLVPRLLYMAKHVDKYTPEKRYKRVKAIITVINRTGGIRVMTFGQENLPREGGYIMYANHQGKYDALGIVYSHEKLCAVVMDEARSHALITSQVLDLVGGKRLKKDDIRQAASIIQEISEEAKKGKRFLIFPEGGYYHNHNVVKDFKPGCFKSSIKSQTPIVPVALIDSYKAFEGFHLGTVTTQVHFLPAIPYDEYKDMKTVELSALVRQRIADKIDEVLLCKK